jgi:hypothetical protein
MKSWGTQSIEELERICALRLAVSSHLYADSFFRLSPKHRNTMQVMCGNVFLAVPVFTGKASTI